MARAHFSPALLQDLVERVGTILHKYAPDYEWEVAGSTEGSLIYFYCPDLSGTDMYASALHTKEVQQTTNQNRLLRNAQGEYLERYGLKPTGVAQEMSVLLDGRGDPIPLSG